MNLMRLTVHLADERTIFRSKMADLFFLQNSLKIDHILTFSRELNASTRKLSTISADKPWDKF